MNMVLRDDCLIYFNEFADEKGLDHGVHGRCDLTLDPCIHVIESFYKAMKVLCCCVVQSMVQEVDGFQSSKQHGIVHSHLRA